MTLAVCALLVTGCGDDSSDAPAATTGQTSTTAQTPASAPASDRTKRTLQRMHAAATKLIEDNSAGSVNLAALKRADRSIVGTPVGKKARASKTSGTSLYFAVDTYDDATACVIEPTGVWCAIARGLEPRTITYQQLGGGSATVAKTLRTTPSDVLQ